MNPEESIERYFQFLADPSTLVDQERVNELRRSIDSTTSLMDRALLISELERAESADPTEVVKGFISHGRRCGCFATASPPPPALRSSTGWGRCSPSAEAS